MNHHPKSPTKFHGSWRAKDDDHSSSFNHDSFTETTNKPTEQPAETITRYNACPWSQKEMLTGRPDDYVGGYDPEFIRNYRRQQERKKPMKIEGYNAKK